MTARVAVRPTRTPLVTRTTLRLTRRGRLALVLIVTLMVVVAGITLGHGSSLAAGRGDGPARHAVIVRGGETLWSVAARIAPQQDPRLIVADIQSLNHLSGAAVQPGQQLIVPIFS